MLYKAAFIIGLMLSTSFVAFNYVDVGATACASLESHAAAALQTASTTDYIRKGDHDASKTVPDGIRSAGRQLSTMRRVSRKETIYRVSFCALIRNPDRYDQKLIRLHAIYEAGIDSSALYDPKCAVANAWIRDTCSPTILSCRKLHQATLRAHNIRRSRVRIEVDVVGLFRARAREPLQNQNAAYVRLLEILKVMSAKPISGRAQIK